MTNEDTSFDDAFAERLKQFTPAEPSIDSDALLFRAGFQAGQKQAGKYAVWFASVAASVLSMLISIPVAYQFGRSVEVEAPVILVRDNNAVGSENQATVVVNPDLDVDTDHINGKDRKIAHDEPKPPQNVFDASSSRVLTAFDSRLPTTPGQVEPRAWSSIDDQKLLSGVRRAPVLLGDFDSVALSIQATR